MEDYDACRCCRMPLSEAEQNEPKVEGLSFCEKCRPVMKACAAVTAAVREFAERWLPRLGDGASSMLDRQGEKAE